MWMAPKVKIQIGWNFRPVVVQMIEIVKGFWDKAIFNVCLYENDFATFISLFLSKHWTILWSAANWHVLEYSVVAKAVSFNAIVV